ncbi:MAG TPA: CHASE domain-containing protein [Thermoanaerobaculia bacterium]
MSDTEAQSRRLAAYVPWVVLAVFLVITAVATVYVWENSRLADRARFDTAVQTTRVAIRYRLETYVNVLHAASGLFAANRAATRDEFRAYVRHLQVQQRYPGVQGVGLSLRVDPDHVREVVADLRANDFPDFHIWPESPRPEYYTIVALEPLDRRNRAAIGFDMHTDPSRAEAMDRARDIADAVATPRLTLVQEIDATKQPGFLIYVPIYRVPATPATIEERRHELYGHVYAPFRADDLFNGSVVSTQHPEIRFAIYDGNEQLYASQPENTAQPRFTAQSSFPIAGRMWTIRFASERTGVGVPFLVAAATCLLGMTISFLLFALIRLQTHARANAERTAERLRQSEAQLQQANRAKDEFLATLSHELRTPMTAILGWSKLLADPLDEETHADAVDAIQKSGRAQARLIEDLLDVSRITAGKMRIDPRAVDLVPIVDAAIDAVAPAAESKGVTVRKRGPDKPMVVNADSSRIQQVLSNLLTNAVKFTPRDGTIDVEVRDEDGQACITVTDTGQGIEPDFLPHVFERFRQADSSTTRSYTGLGLGLAIVRNLIELHGGSVKAESEGAGKGARFTVRLPLLDPGTRREPQRSVDERGVAEALQGARVVLVDDEVSVRNYATAVFRESGARLRTAASAAEALELLEQEKPDVVITDIGMPEMDGYELLRRIRESLHDGVSSVPVIALTAYARPEDRDQIDAAGFDGFISKPVEPAPLRAAVAAVLAAAVRSPES